MFRPLRTINSQNYMTTNKQQIAQGGASILLTGGAGYVGSHTALALLQAGYAVVVIDNLCNSSAKSLQAVEHLSGKPVTFVQGNIQDRTLLEATIRQYRIEAVVHFAGLKAVGDSSQDPLLYYDNNVGGTICLLQAMQATNVRQLVFSSSATVYGVPQFLPYTESHPAAPSNPYGQTKRQIELILQDLSQSGKEWHFSILRYFNPVGAHPSGQLGEDPRGHPNNLMPYLAQVAVGKRDALTIFGNDYDTPDGTGVRDYLHVCDLAGGHLAALRYLQSQAKLLRSSCEIFNLGTGEGRSVQQMVHDFERVNGLHITTRIGPRRPGDLPAFWADTSRARDVLGWHAALDIESMCSSTWRWQQSHPNGFDN